MLTISKKVETFVCHILWPQSRPILLGPGAASRNDAILSSESLLKSTEEPLGTYSYRTSSRSARIRLDQWRATPWRLCLFLHDVVFFFYEHVQPEDSRGEFQNNDATKPRKSQAMSQVLEKNSYRSIFTRGGQIEAISLILIPNVYDF